LIDKNRNLFFFLVQVKAKARPATFLPESGLISDKGLE
jgi:hypothetical protein